MFTKGLPNGKGLWQFVCMEGRSRWVDHASSKGRKKVKINNRKIERDETAMIKLKKKGVKQNGKVKKNLIFNPKRRTTK
jgi:hypothetical protein